MPQREPDVPLRIEAQPRLRDRRPQGIPTCRSSRSRSPARTTIPACRSKPPTFA
jgi:hypothetical protein